MTAHFERKAMKFRNLILGAVISALCVTSVTACSSADPRQQAQTMIEKAPASGGNAQDVTIQAGDMVAEFEVEGFGTIKAKLFPDIAPIGVQNFAELALSGYYSGKNIHRVIDGFMFQGGSENGDGTGGDAAYTGTDSDGAASFGIEISENARHYYGALCYANAAGQNSTQFYIVNSKKVDDPEDYRNAISMVEEYRSAYEEGSDGYVYYTSLIERYNAVIDMLNNLSDRYKELGGTPSLDNDYTVFGQVVEGFDVIDSISAVEVTTNSSGEASKPVKDIIIKSVKVYTAE